MLLKGVDFWGGNYCNYEFRLVLGGRGVVAAIALPYLLGNHFLCSLPYSSHPLKDTEEGTTAAIESSSSLSAVHTVIVRLWGTRGRTSGWSGIASIGLPVLHDVYSEDPRKNKIVQWLREPLSCHPRPLWHYFWVIETFFIAHRNDEGVLKLPLLVVSP